MVILGRSPRFRKNSVFSQMIPTGQSSFLVSVLQCMVNVRKGIHISLFNSVTLVPVLLGISLKLDCFENPWQF